MDQMSSPPPAPPMMSSAPAAGAPIAPATRPTGVTVLAVLYFIGAAFLLIAGLLFMVGGSAMSMMGGEGGMFAALGAAMGVGFVVFGVLVGIAGWGLWSRQRWAWYLVMVLEVISVVSSILSLPGGILGLLIAGLIVWYFLTPAVQRWFGVWYNVPWNKGATA